MNPLLPFYGLATLFALLGIGLRKNWERLAVRIAGWTAMAIVMVGVIFRPVYGDTYRYYMTFKTLGQLPFGKMLHYADNNWLFFILNWLLAQLGDNPLWLIAPIALFCLLMLRYSLRQLVGPTMTPIAILLYSAYPFFIFYIASGLKQAIAMALLMQGYLLLHQRQKRGWIWLLLAPLFHTGAVLVFPFLFLHLFTWNRAFGYRRAFILSVGLLALTIILSVTGLNQTLMAPFKSYATFSTNYEIYFMDPTKFNYRAGFRWDFTLFSLLPLLVGWWLRKQGQGLTAERSGWWLNLYVLLACIYQLFSFAPFADRFAAFGWYLIPAIVIVMVAETKARVPAQIVIGVFALANIAILQFYTGPVLNAQF